MASSSSSFFGQLHTHPSRPNPETPLLSRFASSPSLTLLVSTVLLPWHSPECYAFFLYLWVRFWLQIVDSLGVRTMPFSISVTLPPTLKHRGPGQEPRKVCHPSGAGDRATHHRAGEAIIKASGSQGSAGLGK